jgi:hypothetical protein
LTCKKILWWCFKFNPLVPNASTVNTQYNVKGTKLQPKLSPGTYEVKSSHFNPESLQSTVGTKLQLLRLKIVELGSESMWFKMGTIGRFLWMRVMSCVMVCSTHESILQHQVLVEHVHPFTHSVILCNFTTMLLILLTCSLGCDLLISFSHSYLLLSRYFQIFFISVISWHFDTVF